MKPRILLDTHVLVHWLTDDRRLTKEQSRILTDSERHGEAFGVSAVTLVELALLFRAGTARISVEAERVFQTLETDPGFSILPITAPIAREVSAIYPAFHDLADAVIAATARVHGLRLVTSDQRIVASNLVSTIE